MDLTFYEHTPLVLAAFSRLVEHHQQRTRLHRLGRKVQLLRAPAMVAMCGVLDALLAPLARLAQRRTLMSSEQYDAVRLMGLLTM